MDYTDVKKSFIISSPAGSGKTEKLARRYISLLDSGGEVERILAITFTEKAASEMKQRILKILSSEKPGLYGKVKPRVPLMRISTIHAFCLRLLKRFSLELGLDPDLSVADEGAANSLWQEAVADALRSEAVRPALFFEMMKDRGIRGWDGLLAQLEDMYRQRPLSELILKERLDLRSGGEERFLELFNTCLNAYRLKKRDARLIDFSDLELLAYKALLKSPDWQNILYSFDEHTDHILVDEFQDTSALQWRLLDKLTEEWRSGMGAKRESGAVPTIFLVGDEKQSIYFFRGADVSVVKKARERLSSFMGPEYEFHEVKDNYRSLPEIIRFTNALFERLMPRGLGESWQVDYSPFEARRAGEGKVQLLLLEPEQGFFHTKEKRAAEAKILARRIKTLRRNHEIYGADGNRRLCDYADMAILLRQRTHLAAFEEALRKEGVPFLVLKGMGFYDEPEVAALREFASFIADPADDYSLFCLLRSPLFGMGYKNLLGLRKKGVSLMESLGQSGAKKAKEAAGLLGSLAASSAQIPIARLMEKLLVSTSGWMHFWEGQRHANVKKFIAMVEAMEAQGMNPVEIRDKLMAERYKGEVSKANVNSEGMDAVKLMTVHAAKGLQFPMVFLPCLDEDIGPKSSAMVIEEIPAGKTTEEPVFSFRYEPEAAKRKDIPAFERNKRKELEEEKRLFYVAVTRAMDYIFMSGFREEKIKGRLLYLEEAFGLDPEKSGGEKRPFELVAREEIEGLHEGAQGIELKEERHFLDEPVYAEPFDYEPSLHMRDVTEDILVKTRHGKDWVLLGRLIHQVLEELSRGTLKPSGTEKRASLLLSALALEPARREKFLRTINEDIEKLANKGILGEVILPRENAYSELPFAHERGKTLYKGRIDRLILKDGEALVYDYKSFPAKNSDIGELTEKYRYQMELYREAAGQIYGLPARAFIIFTHMPLVIELAP
ncbi:MAG: UvrD-helicase domain-containing protein [Nitrospiraceae bacterium]|nr:UvrD-helicase domain-containing protein [Nitrospiraceae bacterium]